MIAFFVFIDDSIYFEFMPDFASNCYLDFIFHKLPQSKNESSKCAIFDEVHDSA